MFVDEHSALGEWLWFGSVKNQTRSWWPTAVLLGVCFFVAMAPRPAPAASPPGKDTVFSLPSPLATISGLLGLLHWPILSIPRLLYFLRGLSETICVSS